MTLKLDIPLINKPTVTPLSANHPTGDAFFKNKIALVSPQYDAEVKTGRALALGATNDLPIPIHNNGGANSFLTYHDIANDEIIQIGNAVDGGSSKELGVDVSFDTVWDTTGESTSNGDGTVHILSTTGDGSRASKLGAGAVIETGKTYIIEVECSEYTTGDVALNITTANFPIGVNGVGTFSLVINSLTDGSLLAFLRVGVTDLVLSSYTIKEILPTSTTYTFNNVTLNNILTHQMPFSEGDLTLIQQEPNLLAALAMGEATPISSVTLDADDSWYACGEVSGAEVVDARSIGVVNEDVTSWSVQTSGVGNSYTSTGTQGEYDLVGVAVTAQTYHPRILGYNDAFQDGEVYLMRATLEVHTGSMSVTSLNITGGDNLDINETVSAGNTKEYNLIVGVWGGFNGFQFNGIEQPIYTATAKVEFMKLTASEIADYDESIRLTNQQKGLQTTALLLDSAGVPESYNSTPNTARVYDDTIISTNFKPSIARFSIEETISGNLADLDVNGDPLGTFSQRTEKRLLTHTTAKLGDDFLQTSTPTNQANNIITLNGAGYTAVSTSASTTIIVPRLLFTNCIEGKKYLLDVTTTINSGSTTHRVRDGDGLIVSDEPVVGGRRTYSFIAGSADPYISYDGQNNNFDLTVVGTIREVSTENKYYIGTDGGAMVEQTVVPPLPDPNSTINLDNTCVIGYPDTIESREANFNIHSDVITP